ncbi:uncharacterized protein [Littorina saxatilis]
MADVENESIKVTDLSLKLIYELRLGFKPRGLALSFDRKQLYVTSQEECKIVVIDVENKRELDGSINTSKPYWGIGTWDDKTLVVSYSGYSGKHGKPSVDVITVSGLKVTVIRTLCTPDVLEPHYLSVHSGKVFISDRHHDKSCVYVVDLITGELTETLKHALLQSPCQVCTDHGGNLYVASHKGQCVLKHLTANRQWLEVARGPTDNAHPKCVSVAGTRLLVSWGKFGNASSVLQAYNMSPASSVQLGVVRKS